MLALLLNQTFAAHDLLVILILIVLEGVLSIDNAVVLGLLARRLPVHQRARALSFGLIGAFVFRLLAIVLATTLLKWNVFKLIGGAYLLYVAIKHFFEKKHGEHDLDELGVAKKAIGKFWPTVAVIELTDMAFAVDSILAAIGVVGPPPTGTPADALHPKLWVVFLGGFFGVILMRYAAMAFTHLIDRFPRFEPAAYLLVLVIGAKLVLDWADSKWNWPWIDFHHANNPGFWAFWTIMIGCFIYGFMGGKPKSESSPPSAPPLV